MPTEHCSASAEVAKVTCRRSTSSRSKVAELAQHLADLPWVPPNMTNIAKAGRCQDVRMLADANSSLGLRAKTQAGVPPAVVAVCFPSPGRTSAATRNPDSTGVSAVRCPRTFVSRCFWTPSEQSTATARASASAIDVTRRLWGCVDKPASCSAARSETQAGGVPRLLKPLRRRPKPRNHDRHTHADRARGVTWERLSWRDSGIFTHTRSWQSSLSNARRRG